MLNTSDTARTHWNFNELRKPFFDRSKGPQKHSQSSFIGPKYYQIHSLEVKDKVITCELNIVS